MTAIALEDPRTLQEMNARHEAGRRRMIFAGLRREAESHLPRFVLAARGGPMEPQDVVAEVAKEIGAHSPFIQAATAYWLLGLTNMSINDLQFALDLKEDELRKAVRSHARRNGLPILKVEEQIAGARFGEAAQ